MVIKFKIPTRKEIEPFFDDFIFKDDLRREVQIQARLIQALQYHIKLLHKHYTNDDKI